MQTLSKRMGATRQYTVGPGCRAHCPCPPQPLVSHNSARERSTLWQLLVLVMFAYCCNCTAHAVTAHAPWAKPAQVFPSPSLVSS